MLIFIRHSIKQPGYDLSLKPEGRDLALYASNVILSMIQKLNDFPIELVSSPFLRTRETAQIFSLVAFGKEGKFTIDSSLGEYRPIVGELDPETAKWGVPLDQSKEDFMKRMNEMLKKYLNKSRNKNIVIIAHGTVISYLSYISGINIRGVNFMNALFLQQDGNNFFFKVKDDTSKNP